MPAQACSRDRLAGLSVRLVEQEVDDIVRGRYDFLNHGVPRYEKPRYVRKISPKRSAQRSNFRGEIEAGKRTAIAAMQEAGHLTEKDHAPQRDAIMVRFFRAYAIPFARFKATSSI